MVFAGIFYLVSRQRWRRKLFMQQIEQEKTRELSEMKLSFYTNITHELRTPLRSSPRRSKTWRSVRTSANTSVSGWG